MKKKIQIFLSSALLITSPEIVISANTFEVKIPGKSGEFNQEEALNTINQWRKLAIENDYFGLRTLYGNNFVEIKYSSHLEDAAKERAAEASIFPEHWKLDGSSPKYGEILAWNAGSGINDSASVIGGLNSWIKEKNNYEKNKAKYDKEGKQGKLFTTDPEVGHFYSLIDPKNKSIGLASYKADLAITKNPGSSAGIEYTWGAVAGALSREDTTKLAKATEAKNINDLIFKVKTTGIKNLKLDKLTLELPDALGTKDQGSANATININGEYGGSWITTVPIIFNSKEWTSSDAKIITIGNNGELKPLKAGTATITLNLGDGLTASKEITVKDGNVTVDEMYPFLKPEKKKAEEKIEQIGEVSFSYELIDKYKQKIANAKSIGAIQSIVTEAEVEAKNLNIIAKDKEKVLQALNNYYTTKYPGFLFNTDPNQFQDAYKAIHEMEAAKSLAEMKALYEKHTKKPFSDTGVEIPVETPELPTEADKNLKPDPTEEKDTNDNTNGDIENENSNNQADKVTDGDNTTPVPDDEKENDSSNSNSSTETEEVKSNFIKKLEQIDRESKDFTISRLLLLQNFEIDNSRLNKLIKKTETGIWVTLDNNQFKYKNNSVNSNGITVGYDKKIKSTTIGILASYKIGKVKSLLPYNPYNIFNEKNNSFSTGIYGIHRIGNFYAGGLLNYQVIKIKGIKKFYSGNATLQGGYTINIKNNISISPQINVAVSRIKSGILNKYTNANSIGTSLNINYTPSNTFMFGISTGIHRVKIGEMKGYYPESIDKNMSSNLDIRYDNNISTSIQITPLFNIEGTLGYTKYQKSKLAGISYGIQVNYKF
ncbi:hypothetical protein CEP48_07550 [Mergibacter septicus]|uniref:Uncharacterized protein n=1 Tax=Mergibacter septicus TaxID=221402 RepID=A0A8E3MHG7_9PAST|nr:autotransporter domain-containing protein [Mergibacter septicus]AWX16032.1 hypothetical protein CEP47_07550 [Mergibacter septicus]QDJ15285.1 hypothetical protein CEP48_07550 [Mergibacter septicus]UTU47298.1 autotransporter domain-containing protein [Mergibacter septicus]WMR95524.1 autotransporter domain-containing protein [Mergibacter septicus]